MHSLSLTQVFGEGAFQDANVLIIQKASLLRLSPSPNNTAESLLTAILISALSNFKGTIKEGNNEAIADENNQSIGYDNSDAFELIKMTDWNPFRFYRSNQPFINHQIIVFSYASD